MLVLAGSDCEATIGITYDDNKHCTHECGNMLHPPSIILTSPETAEKKSLTALVSINLGIHEIFRHHWCIGLFQCISTSFSRQPSKIKILILCIL